MEIEGWFADPLPTVPVDQNSPTVALQATLAAGQTLRPIDLAYTNNAGQLVHGYTADPSLTTGGNTDYTTLSGGETFTGTPAMAEQANGLLTIAAHHTDSDVWALSETTKVPLAWDATWTKLGNTIIGHPAIGKFSDGRLVLFGIDADGALWVQSQAAANGVIGAWNKLVDVDLAGTPVVVTNPSGVVQIFDRNQAGNIVTATYTTAGVLSAWTNLGNPETALDATGTPAVVPGPSTIRVFVRTPDGTIHTLEQTIAGTWPTTWDTIPGMTTAGPPAAVLNPADGTHEVTARNNDGALVWTAEVTRDSGTWTTWEATRVTGLTTQG